MAPADRNNCTRPNSGILALPHPKGAHKMISARILAISIPWALLSAPSLCAGDLSRYHEFQLGMNLPAVVKLVGMSSSGLKVIHQRPELIQELDWQPKRYPGAFPDVEPVK